MLVRVLNGDLCKPFAAAAVSSFLGLGLVLDCHSCSLPSLVLTVIFFIYVGFFSGSFLHLLLSSTLVQQSVLSENCCMVVCAFEL